MKRTASTSPGTAPRTAIGPVRQWPLRLLLAIVGTSSPGNVCGCRCPDAFRARSTIVSPGSTVSTGGRSRENTSAVVDGDGSSWWPVMQRSSPPGSSATMRYRQLELLLQTGSRGNPADRWCCLSGAAAVEPPEAAPGQGQGEGQEHPRLGPLQGPVVAGGLIAFGDPDPVAGHAVVQRG